jgi:hypothetical protein
VGQGGAVAKACRARRVEVLLEQVVEARRAPSFAEAPVGAALPLFSCSRSSRERRRHASIAWRAAQRPNAPPSSTSSTSWSSPPDRNSARGANTCRPSLPCSGNSLPQALSPRELDSSPPPICNLQCYALTKPPRSGLDHMERPAHDRNVVGIANGITMQPSTVGPVVVDCGGGAGAPLGPASFACTVTGSWWLDTDDPANAALVTRPVPPLVVTLSGGELSPGAVGAPVDISMTVQLMKK